MAREKTSRKGSQAETDTSTRIGPDGVSFKHVTRDAFETREEYEERYFEETGKRLGGRKEWQPTAKERLQAAVAFAGGASLEAVGRFLGVGYTTAAKHLAEEFETASEMRNLALQSKMVERAMAGDTAMLIFLSKNWLGYRDRQDVTSGDQALPAARQELCLRVEYVLPTDPRANRGPPPELLEAPAREVE